MAAVKLRSEGPLPGWELEVETLMDIRLRARVQPILAPTVVVEEPLLTTIWLEELLQDMLQEVLLEGWVERAQLMPLMLLEQ